MGRGAPTVAWTLRLIDRVARTGCCRFPERLLLLCKAVYSLRGVLDDLAGRQVAGDALARAGLFQLFRELPQRLVLPPTSRRFGSHLSTADLLGLLPDWPLESVRFWKRVARAGRRR